MQGHGSPRATAAAAVSSSSVEEEMQQQACSGLLYSQTEKEELIPVIRTPPPPPNNSLLSLNEEQLLDRYDAASRQCGSLGYFEQLAMDRMLVKGCLDHYNLKHSAMDWSLVNSINIHPIRDWSPGNEYEPAPGRVYLNPHFHNGTCWIHGNFMARKKRSGCFSLFFPAPRTLFFFELAYTTCLSGIVTCTPLDYSRLLVPTLRKADRNTIRPCTTRLNEVVTCTPLDEPVTESYSVLGFTLGWSTRRSGKSDSFCKTCYRRFDVSHPCLQKIFPCGHKNMEKVCEMCYLCSHVLHPSPGEFAFGYHHPYRPYRPTKH